TRTFASRWGWPSPGRFRWSCHVSQPVTGIRSPPIWQRRITLRSFVQSCPEFLIEPPTWRSMDMSDPAADSGRALRTIPLNRRQAKPREVGLTEIRGPIYAPMGINYLMDLFSTMGPYVDSFKFGAAAFALMPRQAVKEMVDLCHEHDVKVSTGGAMET